MPPKFEPKFGFSLNDPSFFEIVFSPNAPAFGSVSFRPVSIWCWSTPPPEWYWIQYKCKSKCRWFIVHYAFPTWNSMWPQHTFQSTSVLTTEFESLPGLSGAKRLIAAYIWRNSSWSNSHPHRICNFYTLNSGLDLNMDDQ